MVATEQDHLDAVMAVLEAAQVVAYTVQQAQRVAVTPPNWAEVGLERLPGGPYRATGVTGRRSYIVNLVVCGRTHEGALDLRSKASAALEGLRMTVGGLLTTPLKFDSSNQVDLEQNTVGKPTPQNSPRAGYYVGAESYTYAH